MGVARTPVVAARAGETPSLAGFDPAFGASTAILADTRDGQPLNDHEGPFRIIAADDERQGRWVRQVQRIEFRFAAGATK